MNSFYKKSLAILCSSIIISTLGCTNTNGAPAKNLNPNSQIQTYSNNQAMQTIKTNKNNISTIVESITSGNFAGNLEQLKPLLSSLTPNDIKNIYNILTKNIEAQNFAYTISDGPVGQKFNAPSIPDNVPKISSQEISKLKSMLKAGDVILCGNDKSFVHAIFYTGDNVIVHSLATLVNGKLLGVVKQTLDEYLAKSERDTFVVLRHKNLNSQDLQKGIDYANKQVGKGYDTLFLVDSDTRFYCTEFVYQILKKMSNPPKIFTHEEKIGWTLVTVEDFMDSPDFTTIWTRNYTRPQTGQLHSYQK